MATATKPRRWLKLHDIGTPRTVMPRLRIEIFEGDTFCRYVDLPDPRAEYCTRFNKLAEAEDSPYRAAAEAASAGRILLDIKEASEALAISGALLWKYSAPRGPIPVVRIGGRKMYSVDALRDWARNGGRA